MGLYIICGPLVTNFIHTAHGCVCISITNTSFTVWLLLQYFNTLVRFNKHYEHVILCFRGVIFLGLVTVTQWGGGVGRLTMQNSSSRQGLRFQGLLDSRASARRLETALILCVRRICSSALSSIVSCLSRVSKYICRAVC